MNKTLKTIAWICLALGLMGTVADGGTLIYSRARTADRQAAIAGNATERLDNRNLCIAEDKDDDGKPDGDCLDLPVDAMQGQAVLPGSGQPGFERQPGFGRMSNGMQSRFGAVRFGLLGILPLFFFALGPILAVIGAVILLVNREPKKGGSTDEVKIIKEEDVAGKEAKTESRKVKNKEGK